MSEESYNYIAKYIFEFFQSVAQEGKLLNGSRYFLGLDTDEMVEELDYALKDLAKNNNTLGEFIFSASYSTFTIRFKPGLEMVIASKIKGMTNDFMATLRNAELTEKRLPILMISASSIDTITSGTGNLSANGMPFNPESIEMKIKKDIEKAELKKYETSVLNDSLKQKRADRYNDETSLSGYFNLFTVLSRGYLVDDDYPGLDLLPDPSGTHLNKQKDIDERLRDNRKLFEEIDFQFNFGKIENLKSDFDNKLINRLKERKRKDLHWYEGLDYQTVKDCQQKKESQSNNPLSIDDENFSVYSGSPLENSFEFDKDVYVRSKGTSKAASLVKYVLVYNHDCFEEVQIEINTNVSLTEKHILCNGCELESSKGGRIVFNLECRGCTFAKITLSDPKNEKRKYEVYVCVLNLPSGYFKEIHNSYSFKISKNHKNDCILASGITKELKLNPECEKGLLAKAEDGESYNHEPSQYLELEFDDETFDSDNEDIKLAVTCDDVLINLRISGEKVRIEKKDGFQAFKLKYKKARSFEYDSEKYISSGTDKYEANAELKSNLALEEKLLEHNAFAMAKIGNEWESQNLELSESVKNAYLNLLNAYRAAKTLPSLCYYKEDTEKAAVAYIKAVEEEIRHTESGRPLSDELSNLLLIGSFLEDDGSIKMSPVHPLNVCYQLQLKNEKHVGDVQDNLVRRLSALYLLPYIRKDRKLYKAVDQKDSPEWRCYSLDENASIQGSKNFVARLFPEKVDQYRNHFDFLFSDNNQLCVNLINMGDCAEIFSGMLAYYAKALKDDKNPDDLLRYRVNVYSASRTDNAFSLLSNEKKLRNRIIEDGFNDIASDLVSVMTSKIKCYFHSDYKKTSDFNYAHLTFYAMPSSTDTANMRMDNITTGMSLGGLISGVPSLQQDGWYVTGFGAKYSAKTSLTDMARYYNAAVLSAFSSNAFEEGSSIFTQLERNQDGLLDKIYRSSQWVVFVDPKVDLSFFQRSTSSYEHLMIIHYSDQYSSSSGYDDITVTQKAEQYREIIKEQLNNRGVSASSENIDNIIRLFNAVNGDWLLRLVSAKKPKDANDSNFSREKMSILSAIKICLADYSSRYPDIVWIPISLEEILRVSGGVGLSQNEGVLSAKNLGFDQKPTSDDLLLVGIGGTKDAVKVYLHPVEVKIGKNPPYDKALVQVQNTSEGLSQALWHEEKRDWLGTKLTRNFFIQQVIVSCIKLKLYEILPDSQKLDLVLDEFREQLLNDEYEISMDLDPEIGKGTVIAFKTGAKGQALEKREGFYIMELPERKGSEYMVMSIESIKDELKAFSWDATVSDEQVDDDSPSGSEFEYVDSYYTDIGDETVAVHSSPEENHDTDSVFAGSNDKEPAETTGVPVIDVNEAAQDDMEADDEVDLSELVEVPVSEDDYNDVGIKVDASSYKAPPIRLLSDYSDFSKEPNDADRETGEKIRRKLGEFKVNARVTGIVKGPAVTLFELKLQAGTPVANFTKRANDIAYGLGGKSIRIVAPIPGKEAVGVEVPNDKRETIGFKGILKESSRYPDFSDIKIPMFLGRDNYGTPKIIDVAKCPHLLIAGSTNSGKSVCINTFINTILYTRSPEEVRLIMVDPKKVELTGYNGIPHLLAPVITDASKAIKALNWLKKEMDDRYKLLQNYGAKNIESLNKKIALGRLPMRPLPYIILIMDEFADLMNVAKDDIEKSVDSLAALARAAGIHLVLATQRPSADVITGTIKNNIPGRIAFKVQDGTNSRIILDEIGAEDLLGKGDMLLKLPDESAMTRVQGAFLSDDEIDVTVDFVTKNNHTDYLQDDLLS